MNNPLKKNDEKKEKKEKEKEKANIKNEDLNPNIKIKDISEKEEEESDFNNALNKVLSKMIKKKNINNNELYDLLVSDKEIIENELKKYNIKKNINLLEKFQNYVDIKNKNLNIMIQKNEEEFHQKHTFIPQINKKYNDKKRNFNQFLKDQEEYQQKKIEKISNIKDTQSKKEEEELKLKPKIQIISEKMAQEKYKGEEVFSRLYNQNTKKTIDKDNIKKNEKNEKNIKTVNNNLNEEYLNNLYQDYKLREKKNKEKEDLENKKMKDALNYQARSTSNKYLYNKFKNAYKKEIEKILTESDKNTKLNLTQLKNLFINLNFIPKSQSDNENINNLINEIYENLKDSKGLMNIDHIFIFCISILKLFEYYILSNYQISTLTTIQNESVENNNNNKEITNSVSQKDLKINNFNKLLHKNNSVKYVNSVENKNSKLDFINKELQNRIIKNMKYGGFDIDNNFIISCNHAKLIFKNFLIFYQNYSNPNINKENPNNEFSKENIKKKQMIRASTSNSVVHSYKSNKPKIYERNNNNLTQNNTDNNNYTNQSTKKQKRNKSNSNLGRIEQLYLDNAKKKINIEKEKEKYLEQKEKDEKKNCTFKPKINANAQYKNNLIPIGNNSILEQRMDFLYKKGTEQILNKKDKTLDEIEVEKYKNELTFKPQINSVNYDVFKKNYDIDDYDIQKFNQRLQKGREERGIRESAFERGEFLIQNPRNFSEKKNDKRFDYNKVRNGSKQNKRSFIESSCHNLSKTPIKNIIKYKSNSKNKNKIFKSKSKVNSNNTSFNNINSNKINENENNNDNNNKNNNKNNNENNINNNNSNNIKVVKENENPILQIDVNLKHGLKKKVYVYEGDTAEELANNFSIENGLDDKMKKKLKTLIQQEIDKLLTRIDEESRSTFKSTNNM